MKTKSLHQNVRLERNTKIESTWCRVNHGHARFKKLRLLLSVVGVLISTTIAVSIANAETFAVPNFSFESPDLTIDGQYTTGNSVPNWSQAFSGNSSAGVMEVPEYQYKYSFGNNSPLPGSADGGQCGFLELPSGAPSSVSLTTSSAITTVKADTDYFLSVALGNELQSNSNQSPQNKHPAIVTVAILVDTDIVASASVDGATLAKNTFTDLTVSFRASSGSAFVGRPLKARVSHAFDSNSTTGFRVDVDNVRFATTPPPPPTPTPAPTPSPTPSIWRSRVATSFPGASSYTNDNDAAVGPNHFVELTNEAFRVHDKKSGMVVFSTSIFFQEKMNLNYVSGDQRIRFDHASQRWIAIGITNLRSSNSGFLIGASATSDPTGNWAGFFLKADPTGQRWCDYTLLGIDAAGVYLTTALIPVPGGSASSGITGFFSIPKSDVLSAAPTGQNVSRLQPPSNSGIDPQTDYRGISSNGVLSNIEFRLVGNDPGVRWYKSGVSGASGPGATLTSPVTIDLAIGKQGDLNIYGDNRQPQTNQILGKNPGAVTAVRAGKFLYNVSIQFDGFFWTKLDLETNTGVQGGYIGDPDHVYMNPSISANEAGDVVIAYTRSGPKEFGSSYASVGTVGSNGKLTFDPPLLLKSGFNIYDETAPAQGGIPGARWSDFSSAVSVDPLDSTHFWISSPYVSGRNKASTQVTELVIDPTPAGTTLANLSTRLRVETGNNVLIGGFIVTGTQPKKVILRAIGPSLGAAGVPGALGNPILELHDTSSLLASNDNWVDAANKQEIIDSTVAPTSNLESAILITLPANNSAYTAIVRGVNDGTGVGLVEAYDLDRGADSKLANISTRGLVQTGNDVMIAGFIVLGQTTQTVIVRAIGPSLPILGKLADPTLELHDSNGVLLASNDNWRSTQEAEIIATTIPPSADLESAIVATLAPAPYTAIVRGKENTTGVALVEVYALQPNVAP